MRWWRPAGSSVLRELRRQLFDRSQRYRNLVRRTHERDELAEHRRIMEACLAHNVARASKLLSRHFQLTTDLVITRFDRLIKAGKRNPQR